MSFQAMVGTWLAAHLISDIPAGSRFGLEADLRAKELQFETGDALDDAVLRLENDGAIYVQCKTRAGLDAGADSALAKTINQLVNFVRDRRDRSVALDPRRVAAVLAIGDDAPRSIDALEEACRRFDHGGTWHGAFENISDSQQRALELFKNHAERAWNAKAGDPISDGDLVELARLFRIRRFGVDESSSDWREISNIVGSRLYGGEEFGSRPSQALLGIVRRLIRSGASTDRVGLTQALRAAGYPESRAPGFDSDIAALQRYTNASGSRATLPFKRISAY
jgi:hypothetical protein